MANEAADQNSSLLRSVSRMLESTVTEGTSVDSLVQVLSLVCLVSILNRSQQQTAARWRHRTVPPILCKNCLAIWVKATEVWGRIH